MQTCECQKTEQPGLVIEFLTGVAQALPPDSDQLANLGRRQRGAIAASSKSMGRRPRLSDDARLIGHRIAHAALSNPSEKVSQPIEKPCNEPEAAGDQRTCTDRST